MMFGFGRLRRLRGYAPWSVPPCSPDSLPGPKLRQPPCQKSPIRSIFELVFSFSPPFFPFFLLPFPFPPPFLPFSLFSFPFPLFFSLPQLVLIHAIAGNCWQGYSEIRILVGTKSDPDPDPISLILAQGCPDPICYDHDWSWSSS